jgi:hypothetical protein
VKTPLRVSLVLLMSVAASACETPKAWSKVGGTPEEFAKIRTRCLANSAVARAGITNVIGAGDDRFQACMKTNGWTIVRRPAETT